MGERTKKMKAWAWAIGVAIVVYLTLEITHRFVSHTIANVLGGIVLGFCLGVTIARPTTRKGERG